MMIVRVVGRRGSGRILRQAGADPSMFGVMIMSGGVPHRGGGAGMRQACRTGERR